MQSYQVGEIDENGFVCIGIEERKVQNNIKELNARSRSGTMVYSDQGSDYSSFDEDSNGFNSMGSDSKSNRSKYKNSLDFLVEQGVRVKDVPQDSDN